MAELVLSVEVEAPPEAVWAGAVDWAGQSTWMVATRVRPAGREAQGAGARIDAVTGIGPFGFRDPMEVTYWRPPYRCEMRHLGRVVRGTGAFEVEPLAGGRSRFVWCEWLDLPLGLLGQFGFVLVKPLLRAAFTLSLQRFARWVPARMAG